MEPIVHIVGAGLAGLAAAVALAAEGRQVALYEAAGHAGGRCRSYHDRELDCRIDNGNHLMLAANHEMLAYVGRIGALDSLTGPTEPVFPFLDLTTGERWTLRPNLGRIPWWIFQPGRRVPGTRARDYLKALALFRAAPDATVAACLEGHGPIYRRLWEPLTIAALNTACSQASAALFGHILRESFGKGGQACRPLLPKVGLSETLIDPALAFLAEKSTLPGYGKRLRRLESADDRLTALVFGDETVALGPKDQVILAVPAPVAAELLPDLPVPTQFRSIVNAHFRCDVDSLEFGFLGVINSLAEWIFTKPGMVSVTISAADHVVDQTAEDLAAAVWLDVAAALGIMGMRQPPSRIVKEKRATFATTPLQLTRRPNAATHLKNLSLAGDWTATGLPSTIEGAIQSGHTAAKSSLCAAQ